MVPPLQQKTHHKTTRACKKALKLFYGGLILSIFVPVINPAIKR
jgi:hypothetical protein